MSSIDIELFRKYETEKLITCRPHENGELLIWNYSPVVQYSRAWDDVTMMCRGLITTLDGMVVARPFRKFFNLGEHTEELPSLEGATVTEKYDGSLGILYHDGHQHCLATRGSFASEQALKGTEMLQEQIINVFGDEWMIPGFTYLFEIIYPQNRIVVDYEGKEQLVLLAAIHTETGEELSHEDLILPNKAEQYANFKDIKELYSLQRDNTEGLVVRFSNGLRLKVKWDEYVRLHRLVTGVNAKTIWEFLSTGADLDELLDHVPDEFFNWVQDKKAELEQIHKGLMDSGEYRFNSVKHLSTRKEQALALQDAPATVKAVAFAFLDGKPEEQIAQRIWKAIKPSYETPYRTDIDS